MTITVHAPNGDAVDFPDGTDDTTINTVMAQQYGGAGQSGAQGAPQAAAPSASPPAVAVPPNQAAPAQAAATPDATPANGGGIWRDALGAYDAITQPVEKLAGLAKTGLTDVVGQPAADAVDRFGNSLLGIHGTTEEVASDKAAMLQNTAEHGLTPSLGGEIVGGAIGTAPATAITGNPFVAGAASGFGLSRSNTLGGNALDTVTGGLLGYGGQKLAQGVGSVINPMIRPAVQRLISEGVRPTIGQIVGGVGQKVEDAMTSMPFLGDMIQNARARGLGDFNLARVNEALSPIGMKVPKEIDPGHEAIAYGQQALSAAYNHLLPSLNLNIDNNSFIPQAVKILVDHSASLGPAEQAAYKAFFNGKILPALRGGNMTGDAMQTIDSALGSMGSKFRAAGDAYQQTLGQAYTDLQGVLRQAVEQANPQAAEQLRNINSGWANMTRLEQAAGKPDVAPTGVVTPNQYKTATTDMDATSRNRASAGGNARGQQSARDAQDVLGSKVPGGENMMRRLLVNGGGLGALGVGALAHVNPLLAVPYGLAMAPYSKIGQSIGQAATTARPAWAAGVREVSDMAAPYLGRLAASAAPRTRQHSPSTGSH